MQSKLKALQDVLSALEGKQNIRVKTSQFLQVKEPPQTLNVLRTEDAHKKGWAYLRN